ncbi:MAG: hypothetical protein LBB66_10395 [Desulfovibrio sp.]|jgi:hypothetical protein|nr:hypothetical protein [Desulfovibrio sp.]
MAFQSAVESAQPLGFPGQFYDASIRRVTVYPNPGLDEEAEAVGKAFTLAEGGNVQLGGSGKFAGILCHPLSLGRQGFGATLAVADNDALELADMGRLVVQSAVAANPGDPVYFNATSGAIAGTAEDEGLVQIPGATFALFGAEAGGLAVIQLDPGVTIQVEAADA